MTRRNSTTVTNTSDVGKWLAQPGSGLSQIDLRVSSENFLTSTDRARDALAQTPERTPLYAQRLNTLAVELKRQYGADGSMASLQEAFERLEAALKITPPQGDALYPRLLHNLSEAFRAKYLTDCEPRDLGNAIALSQKAADRYPKGSMERIQSLNSLAANLREKHNMTMSENDWQDAKNATNQVLEECGECRPEFVDYFMNLALVQGDRIRNAIRSEKHDPETFEILKNTIDLRQDIDKHSRGRAEKARNWNGLAELYLFRFKEKGEAQDLEKSLKNVQLSVDATADDDPARVRRLRTRGDCHREHYKWTNSREELQRAFHYYEMSLNQNRGDPLDRIVSGKKAAASAIGLENWSDAALCLEKCLGLLPRVITRSNAVNKRAALQKLSMLGSVTATVFLKAGRSALESLQALEHYRSIISGLSANSRSDVTTLEKHSSLTEDEIYKLTERGPIVTFNINDFGSHAFVVTNIPSHMVKALPLPGISQADLLSYHSSMPNDTLNPRRVNNVPGPRKVKILFEEEERLESKSPEASQAEALNCLWRLCVKPVLSELGLLRTNGSGDRLSEVWWVGGGLMALLPIHAAGDCELDSLENTMQHVVSSYATSLKILYFSRQMPWRPLGPDSCKPLVVAMPQTTGESDLDTDREIAEIEKHISPSKVDRLENPSLEEVLKQLSTHPVVHFACHGSCNAQYPDESYLIVGKEKKELLTIRDLQSIDQQLSQLAYLSACSTAENATGHFTLGDMIYLRGLHLLDEGIRLVDSFQIAGYRNVIGTLWEAEDSAAVAVAGKFYETLIKAYKRDEPSAVSRALHEAVMFRRSTNRGKFDWMPFIHAGP